MCMSIVASAFQYGCAPTLMPVTTTLISPPCWVNSMIRRSAAATQSMFSVPESIEMRAPERQREPLDRHAQLLGHVERGDDPPALGLGDASPATSSGRPAAPRGVMPSGKRGVKERVRPTTTPASFIAGPRSTGTSAPSASRSCSMNSPRGIERAGSRRSGASTLTSSAGCTEPRRRACTIRRAPSSSGCSGRVAGSSISTITPRPAGANRRSSRSRTTPSRGSRMRPRMITVSMPRPSVSRA